MRRRFLIVFLLALLLTIGTLASLATVEPAPTLAQQQTIESLKTTETVTVTVRDVEFDPETITITVGTTVVWENVEGIHNVDADDDSFGSGMPENAPWTYTHTFTTPGTYPYHCDVHVDIGMTGTVVVEELPPAAYLPVILKE